MNERWPPGVAASSLRSLLTVVACVLVTTAAVSAGGVAAPVDAQNGLPDTLATVAAEAQNQSFPPGTNESGITNATILLDAHESVLRNTTYTERLRTGERLQGETPTAAESTFGPFDVTVRNGSAGTNATVTARGAHSEYWVTENASAEYSTTTEGNVTSELYLYGEGNVSMLDAGPSAVAGIQRGFLSTYVRGANFSHGGTVTRGNDTLYEFRSTAVDASNLTAGGRSASGQDAEVTLLVSERGVIRAASAVVEHATENGTETTHANYSVTDIGETTTSEPAWVTEQLPRFDLSVTGDSRVLALEYTGGGAAANGTLSPGTGVIVYTGRDDATTRLDKTLAPGDTLYLWNESGTVGLQQSVNDAPTVTDSFVPFGGTDASYLVSRFVLASANRGTASSDTTIEVSVGNETTAMNHSAANENTSGSS